MARRRSSRRGSRTSRPARRHGDAPSKLTFPQFRALQRLVPHIASTSNGPRAYPGGDHGPFSGRDAAPWTALEKRGLVVKVGMGVVQSGLHRWKMPTYRITDAGREAYEANVLRTPEGDRFRE